MKRFKRLSLYFITVLLICQVFICCCAQPSSAKSSADNFYFKNLTANYYLSKDDQGKSHLKVVEEFTAVFPDSDQNHGIVRKIPTTNEKSSGFDKTSMVIIPNQHLDTSDIKIKHNGRPEQADTIDHKSGHIAIYIRNPNEYVHGTHNYILEYEYENVITAFDAQKNLTFDPMQENYQELYWNVNGTAWAQPFQSLTARVHITDKQAYDNWKGSAWCYVGSKGSTDQTRCEMIEIEDGMEFATSNLQAKENLTFDMPFAARTFTIPDSPHNYNVVIFTSLIAVPLLTITILTFCLWYRARTNRKTYKKSFKPTQYTPMRELSVAEIANLSLKHVSSISQSKIRTATLVELAIQHKITLVKGEEGGFGKHEWGIRVDDLGGVSPESLLVLQIINQGQEIKVGYTFTITKQKYAPSLKALNAAIDEKIDENLIKKNKLKSITERKTREGKVIATIAGISILAIIAFVVISATVLQAAGTTMVAANLVPLFILPSIILAIFDLLLFKRARQYLSYTDKGLDAAIYLDGLYEYIKLAEADRLKILQSVKGADTSPQGIVKLYEKLLPYAIIFGLEKSWLDELNRYYQMADVDFATWYIGTRMLVWSDFNSFSSGIGTSISSGSGSGGGGFSGGGGGGGGGGGC